MERKLSTRAKRLLDRVRDGAFYQAFGSRVPDSMQELVDAGLVTTTGRVVSVMACYVPTTGYTPYQAEVYDRSAMRDEPPPIPEGVYFHPANMNFYSMSGNTGMGNEFFALWQPRAAEFPQAGEDGPGEDEE